MKSISRPVIDRLPVGQLDDFACRQLDRVSAQQRLRRVFVGAQGGHLAHCACLAVRARAGLLPVHGGHPRRPATMLLHLNVR